VWLSKLHSVPSPLRTVIGPKSQWPGSCVRLLEQREPGFILSWTADILVDASSASP